MKTSIVTKDNCHRKYFFTFTSKTNYLGEKLERGVTDSIGKQQRNKDKAHGDGPQVDPAGETEKVTIKVRQDKHNRDHGEE